MAQPATGGGLTEQERRWLERLQRRHPAAIAVAFVLVLAGGSYAIWGMQRLDLKHPAASAPAFDAPIARLESLLTRPDPRPPATERERQLLNENQEHVALIGRLFVLILRLLIGSMLLTVGLILLTATLAQKPLLALLRRLSR